MIKRIVLTLFIVLFSFSLASAESLRETPIALDLFCSETECWSAGEMRQAIEDSTHPGNPMNFKETLEGSAKLFMRMFFLGVVDELYEVNKKGEPKEIETGEGKGSFLDMLDNFGDTIKEYIWEQVREQLDEVDEAGVRVQWQGEYHGFGFNRTSGKWSYFKFMVVEDKDAPPTEQH